MTAAEQYAARLDAIATQEARRSSERPRDRWAGAVAERYRDDPRRELDANLAALAAYVQPDDVVVDVGGGAGRVCLPLALRCREVINVEPSPGMRTEFERLAKETGIANARIVPAAWPGPTEVAGDVVITVDVTYFVRDIVPFMRALEAAARRRVIISVWSIPPPNQVAPLYEVLFGEPMATYPGHHELLPALWDLSILPDIQVLPLPRRHTNRMPPQPTPDQMVAAALAVFPVADPDRARERVEQRFDDLFVQDEAGYAPIWPAGVREMLITWEPRR
jgi:SAM-dependent methyltransferase